MKPGDFLLGVMDFFAILLPGSMATWLVTRHVDRTELLKFLDIGPLDTTTFWVVFLFLSYILGQFVFMLGSELDRLYDLWRQWKRPVADDHTYQAAARLKERLTEELKGQRFTLLKWCRAYVQVQSPGARVEIDRLEADSKFFRAMVVVSALFGVHFLVCTWRPLVGVFCLLLVAPAFIRFAQQRWKMTELCYGTAVIVGATKPAAASGSRTAESD